MLATSADILSFDAYEYAPNLALYPDEVAAFLERGGTLAWGITPNTPAVAQESVESLAEKLLDAMDLLVHKGIHRDDILPGSWITPACGLGTVSQDLAERNLSLTAGVSRVMKERYT